MKEAWDKWIAASIYLHFSTGMTTPRVVIEYADEKINDSHYPIVEVRIDGPEYLVQNNQTVVNVSVNCLIKSVISSADMYAIYRYVGTVRQKFTAIPVKKLGTLVSDDASVIGCLTIKDKAGSRDKGIETHHYGRIDPSLQITQSLVRATYTVTLED